jgi:hypothetical protein
MSDIQLGEIFSGLMICTLLFSLVVLSISFFLLNGYLTYQIILFLREKIQIRNKVKTFKSTIQPKSVWPHLLALIQDGYLSEAESLVRHYELEIDKLREKSPSAHDELERLKNR